MKRSSIQVDGKIDYHADFSGQIPKMFCSNSGNEQVSQKNKSRCFSRQADNNFDTPA